MNQNLSEEVRLNDINNDPFDAYAASLPLPVEPNQETAFDTDNPPWGITAGLTTWILSVVLLFLMQTLFVIPLAIIMQTKGGQQKPEELINNPTFVLLVILSAIPTHLLTSAVVWSVVTNWHKRFWAKLFVVDKEDWKAKRPFVKWLGLEWKNSIEIVVVVVVAVMLFIIAGLAAKFIGGGETELDKMLQSSANARYALAFVAAFTAPIAEELVYRGVLYPASRKMPGVTLAFIGTILLFAAPFVWGSSYKPHTLKILIPAVVCIALGILIVNTSLKEHRTAIAVMEVSLLFALVHVPQYINSMGVIVAIIVLSVGITTVRAVTKRLLPCIILHFIFNGVQALGIVFQSQGEKQLDTPAPQQAFIILKTILFHLPF